MVLSETNWSSQLSGLHFPREERRAHRRAGRPHQDRQLRGLEPGLSPGPLTPTICLLNIYMDMLPVLATILHSCIHSRSWFLPAMTTVWGCGVRQLSTATPPRPPLRSGASVPPVAQCEVSIQLVSQWPVTTEFHFVTLAQNNSNRNFSFAEWFLSIELWPVTCSDN